MSSQRNQATVAWTAKCNYTKNNTVKTPPLQGLAHRYISMSLEDNSVWLTDD